jgi:hypothetical protein
MPKEGAMAQLKQISRPFQIALVAVIVLFALWLVVLRGHSAGSEDSTPAASSSVPTATPQQASGANAGSGSSGSSGSSSSPNSTYHGSAPGVGGLNRAIAKARGAVAQSEQNAHRLQQKSKQASGIGSAQSGQTSSTGASHPGSSANSKHSAASAPAATSPAKAAPSGAAKTTTDSGASGTGTHAKSAVPAMQLKVEGQLKQGKTVAILFWNPKGSVDTVVRRELQAADSKSGGKLAVDVARAPPVGSIGPVTPAGAV